MAGASGGELVSVVGSLQQRLELGDGGSEVNPTLALGDGGRDTSILQPLLNGLERALLGSKEFSDLFLGVMLAVIDGVRVRTVEFCQIQKFSIWSMSLYIHVHEKLHALVQVALLQSNTDRDNGVSGSSSALDESAVNCTALVDNILSYGDTESSGAESAEENSSNLHDGGY